MDTIKMVNHFESLGLSRESGRKFSGNSEKQKLPVENHYTKSLDLEGKKITKIIYIIKNS